MPTPERAQPDTSPTPTRSDRVAELGEINRQLEVVDENENPAERFFKRDQLLEIRDWLELEMDARCS